jgi:hypothetical protein
MLRSFNQGQNHFAVQSAQLFVANLCAFHDKVFGILTTNVYLELKARGSSARAITREQMHKINLKRQKGIWKYSIRYSAYEPN